MEKGEEGKVIEKCGISLAEFLFHGNCPQYR